MRSKGKVFSDNCSIDYVETGLKPVSTGMTRPYNM